MTVSPDQHRRRRRGARASGIVLTAVGSLLALLGMTVLPWFRVSGPDVIYRLLQIPADASGPLTVIDPQAGRSHGPIVWSLLLLSLLLAIGAQVPLDNVARTTVRVLATAVAVTTAIAVLIRMLAAHLLLATDSSLSTATLRISAGFWVTLVGLVLLAASAATGLRGRNPK